MSAGATPLEAVVLAGGLGTRLAAVLPDRPKALAPIGGRPFIRYLLDWLARGGVRRAVLSVGHLAPLVEATLGSSHGALELAYAVERSPLGTGGAIAHAAAHTSRDPLLVLNGDSFVEFDLAALVRTHARRPGYITLAAVAVPDSSRFGTVHFDDTGRITAFAEKAGVAVAGTINAGVYVVPREVVRRWPMTRPLSFERDVLPAELPRGVFTHACPPGTRFIDIGTPATYRDAERFFAEAGS